MCINNARSIRRQPCANGSAQQHTQKKQQQKKPLALAQTKQSKQKNQLSLVILLLLLLFGKAHDANMPQHEVVCFLVIFPCFLP